MKYLIIKADAESDYDHVDIAVVELSDETLKSLRDFEGFIKTMKNSLVSGYAPVLSVQARLSIAEFRLMGRTWEEEFGEQAELSWSVVSDSLPDGTEYLEYEITDMTLDCNTEGFRFVGYGKYTNNKFYTQQVPWSKVSLLGFHRKQL